MSSNQTKPGRSKSEASLKELVKRHPLQRLESPSKGLSALLHTIGLASFTGSFLYLSANPNHINSAYGWHFQFLTIIGLTLAYFTFIVGLLSDITTSRLLFRVKNLLAITSAPMAVLISTLYWSLRLIDPSLVVPPELELPLSTDLGFHAVPAIVLLLDILFFSPPWTITVVPALALSTTIAFGYWYWIELCYTHNGFYPYPIFELLDTKGRVGLFGMSAMLMAGVTSVIGWGYRVLNGIDEVRDGEVSGSVKASKSR